jgi:hypothetical protein
MGVKKVSIRLVNLSYTNFGAAAGAGVDSERTVVVLGKIEVEALVGFAFARDYGAAGPEALLENRDLVGGPEEIAIEVGYGTHAGTREGYDSPWDSEGFG